MMTHLSTQQCAGASRHKVNRNRCTSRGRARMVGYKDWSIIMYTGLKGKRELGDCSIIKDLREMRLGVLTILATLAFFWLFLTGGGLTASLPHSKAPFPSLQRIKEVKRLMSSEVQDSRPRFLVLGLRPHRRKRTRGSGGSQGPIPGLGYAKHRLRWRLLSEGLSTHLPIQQQQQMVALALQHWAEVAPLSFQEDPTSPWAQIDIRLGFGTGRSLHKPSLI